MTVVLASGAFDLLHYGHIRFLEEAKKLGGSDAKLVVIVATDETVRRHKGRSPIIPEDQRRAVVEALKVVDEVLLGYENADFGVVIDRVRPDIIALGFDQDDVESQTMKTIKETGRKIRVVKLGRFGREDLNSSSKIKRKIVEDYVRK